MSDFSLDYSFLTSSLRDTLSEPDPHRLVLPLHPPQPGILVLLFYDPSCHPKLIPVVEHIKSNHIPATLLYTSHPYTDILAWDLLAPAPCGHGLILSIPAPDDCVIPGYAVEQIGDWVKVALKKPRKWIGECNSSRFPWIKNAYFGTAARKVFAIWGSNFLWPYSWVRGGPGWDVNDAER